MPKTAVHYLDTDTFGGCEELVIQLMSGLDRNRWQPILFHHDAPGITRLLDALVRLDIPCRALPPVSSRTALLHMVRAFKQVNASIFHAHLNWPLACRQGVLAARLAGIQGIVATSHLYSPITDARFGQFKQWMQARVIHRYIAVSNEVKNRLCLDLRVPENKVRVVHNGIRLKPSDSTSSRSLRTMLTGDRFRTLVFTPARLHRQKGHVYLLQAAANVRDAMFIFAGEGPELAALEAQAQQLGIQDRVRFLGQRNDVPDLLESCDVFVLPSLFEGLPLSILEAMAAGKPVIATDIGGTNEAVIHGVTGLLVPAGNPLKLAEAIQCLIADKELSDRLAEAGSIRAGKLFSSEAMVRGVTKVYDELV